MMSKKIKFLIPILLAFALLFGYNTQANNNNPNDKLLLSILKYVLTQGHYKPKQLNDDFSKKVYKNFINDLDPSKHYFLQSDIDEFSKYKTDIDDQIKNDDLSFFYLVYNRLSERIKEAESYYPEILAQPFDFNKKEILNVDYDKMPYAKSKAGLINIWRKQLKLSTLSRLYDHITLENDKLKKDKNYKKKSFVELEKAARAKTKENMSDFFIRMHDISYQDWFSTYLNSIAKEFDPHTAYFDASVKKQFDISMSGKIEGIGARLQKKNDYTKVSALISGGPAWKEGELEVGDIILKVAQGDKEPVDIVGMRLDDAIEYIKGKKGTEVKLTVKKLDGTIKVISIIRDVVELEDTFVKSSVVTKNNRKFGIINLPKFYIDFDEKNFRNSATDMAQEIKRLKKENVEGLVIDLRNNGGGSLKTAIEISGLFIGKGPVVQVKYRDRNATVKSDKKAQIEWDGPLVILVNELSASASEIFTAAMQDYGRAVVIGSKQTYGKGTVQSLLDLNRYSNSKEDLGALKMTIQKFYRINGGATQLEGVHSDIMLPDRYTYLKIGERDLENPLPFDKVPAATYSLWNNYTNFNETINNSKKRIADNKYFKLIDDNAKWLKKNQDDTSISLDYKDYKNEINTTETKAKKYDALKKYTTNLTYNSPLYEKPLVEKSKDLLDKRNAWHKNLKKDIYMQEAIDVLAELKLKPELHLVKN
ncbi:MAG: carboxy terminal-processing peptidase [Lutibacter sp.]|nr:carboxy terminal-processing peptidase [Lutibacter sp.]